MADVADGIAYNNHDVDDGLRSGLISIEQLCEVPLFAGQYEVVKTKHPQLSERRAIHEVVRRMINCQVTDLIENTAKKLREASPGNVADVRSADIKLICFSEPMAEQNVKLKQFLRHNLYRHYRVNRMSAKAAKIISALFDAFVEDPHLLPPESLEKVKAQMSEMGEKGRARAVADYIAGMTDRYAIKEYERVFSPSHLT